MTPATPEGPAATQQCEICQRQDCFRFAGRIGKPETAAGAQAAFTDCYKIGYEVARARLVEVERELEVWRNEDAREAKYGWVSKQMTAVESRASAAEGALRAADECLGYAYKHFVYIRDNFVWKAPFAAISIAYEIRRTAEVRDACAAILSGLPPLTSETAGQEWRRLLFLRHGCSGPALYGDDGEMQDKACGIDFRRMSPAEIQARWTQIDLRKNGTGPVESACPIGGRHAWGPSIYEGHEACMYGCGHIRDFTRAALATPAALVPKEAATPKAIAGEHKEEGRDG